MTEADEGVRFGSTTVRWSAAVIAAALVITAVWRMAVVLGATDVDARRHALVDRALDHAEREFRAIELGVLSDARARAAAPELIEALRQRVSGDPGIEPEVIAVAAGMEIEPLSAVEIYDPTPRLLAWNGFAMPMDAAPEEPDFLSGEQILLARDGDLRVALVAWSPVVDGTEVVGVVRSMRLIELHMPVRNQYLRDYTLAEEWSRDTRMTIQVRDPRPEGGIADAIPGRRILRSSGGLPMLEVDVWPPAADETLRLAVTRLDSLLALWGALLLGLVVYLITSWLFRREASTWTALLGFTLVLWSARFGLIALDVPNRWQTGKDPFSPLFDTAHLASAWGGGLLGTIGDLSVTALFALGFALVVARTVFSIPVPQNGERPSIATAGAGLLLGAVGTLLFLIASSLAEHALRDSTLSYFARSGLLPPRLVVVVFGSLLVVMMAAWGLASCAARMALAGPLRESSAARRWGAALAVTAGVAASAWIAGLTTWPLIVALLFFVALAAYAGTTHVGEGPSLLHFLTARAILFGVVLASLMLYPVLEQGQDAMRRSRMLDAADAFAEDRDPRILFAVESALDDGRTVLAGIQEPAVIDSLLERELGSTLIASLGSFQVSASVLVPGRETVARTGGRRSAHAAEAVSGQDQDDLELLRQIQLERGGSGLVVEKLTSPFQFDRFDYVGAAPVADDSGRWLLIRAAQNEHAVVGSTPFPRVLVPAGYYGSRYPDLSIAEFRDDVLVRSFGASFGRSYLDREVVSALRTSGSLWRRESLRDRDYLTWYALRDPGIPAADGPTVEMRTIAVRQAAVNVFDRLYFLLRLTVSGMIVGLVVYVLGIGFRYRAGLLPAPSRRFRDRVLNAFFGVGLVTVAAMGALGLRVVTGENERAIESWLRQHLERVEDTLVQEARGDELPYRVLERTDIDSLAARVGLDLNVYRGFELASTSRPQLARDRLISMRLPIEAFRALFVDGYRFVDVDEILGSFRYTAGYRAFPDEQGVPRYVVSVPTLPEQERIEEERARTIAYLFGALLLLVLVVMGTAAIIANALALPVARIRRGLERVAEGRFDRIQPLDTRDEMSELVGTFNAMQDQLAESRRLLAQQERQLAWREMARQVAHEIKNPLTPMKLQVQQLQKALHDRKEGRSLEDQVREKTATLLDQIQALVRIANEFSSYARMPVQSLEAVDLNEVVREASELMSADASIRFEMMLYDGPLTVEADREALRRVFINFFKNAVEAVPQDRKGRISVSTRLEDDAETGLPWVIAEVADNGCGIADDLAEKIFTPSFSTKTSGAGLGLAIARNTIEELRGRIGFDTQEGKGSTFWVRIPLYDAPGSARNPV